jgi:hypothetical protein
LLGKSHLCNHVCTGRSAKLGRLPFPTHSSAHSPHPFRSFSTPPSLRAPPPPPPPPPPAPPPVVAPAPFPPAARPITESATTAEQIKLTRLIPNSGVSIKNSCSPAPTPACLCSCVGRRPISVVETERLFVSFGHQNRRRGARRGCEEERKRFVWSGHVFVLKCPSSACRDLLAASPACWLLACAPWLQDAC